jgi:hypothetical protein
MIYYAMTETADRARVIAPDGTDVPLWCTTVVLRHDSGFVGFNDEEGTPAMRALVHDAVVVEQANAPGWSSTLSPRLSSKAMHSAFRRAVSLSDPRPALMRELETVSTNNVRAKKNVILARHGKPLLPLTPTTFDDWLTADGRVRVRNAAWIAASCDLFAFWSFSDWGLYAQVLSNVADAALARISRAALDVQATMKQVATESELPSW